MEATDFKNVAIENIPLALFEVAEVGFLKFHLNQFSFTNIFFIFGFDENSKNYLGSYKRPVGIFSTIPTLKSVTYTDQNALVFLICLTFTPK